MNWGVAGGRWARENGVRVGIKRAGEAAVHNKNNISKRNNVR